MSIPLCGPPLRRYVHWPIQQNTVDFRDAVTAFGGLDIPWPDSILTERFRLARTELGGEFQSQSSRPWVVLLEQYFQRLLSKCVSRLPSGDLESIRWLLRETSALAAMLMHLKVTRSGATRWRLINARRNRASYGTYPTSPKVAEVLGRFVWGHLQLCLDCRRQLHVMDPSIEGGPLLLELLFQASSEAQAKSGTAGRPGNRLLVTGVDQNPCATRIASLLFRCWLSRTSAKEIILDLRTADAFDVLDSVPPLDALINNPPWGAKTDGADGARLSDFGPYDGYRDPYIAFVSTGLRHLGPGRPFGFVLPLQVLTAASAGRLREELVENARLEHAVLLPRQAFPRATVRTVLLLGCRRRDGERRRGVTVVHYPMTRRLSDKSTPTAMKISGRVFSSLGSQPWLPIVRLEPAVGPLAPCSPLGDVAEVFLGIEPYRLGRGNPKQTARELDQRPFTFKTPRNGASPVVRSRSVARFRVDRISEYIRIGPWLAAPGRHLDIALKSRTYVRQICGRDGSLTAAPAPAGTIARYGVFTIASEQIEPIVLAALLNSAAAARYVRLYCAGYYKESFGRITVTDLRSMPIPKALLKHDRSARSRALQTNIIRIVRQAQGTIDKSRLRDFEASNNLLIEAAFGWIASGGTLPSASHSNATHE